MTGDLFDVTHQLAHDAWMSGWLGLYEKATRLEEAITNLDQTIRAM